MYQLNKIYSATILTSIAREHVRMIRQTAIPAMPVKSRVRLPDLSIIQSEHIVLARFTTDIPTVAKPADVSVNPAERKIIVEKKIT